MDSVEKKEFRDNSFSFIRYIAAFAVMIGHYLTYAIAPFETSQIYSSVPCGEYVLGTIGSLFAAVRGVPMFFGMSAFLICASIERSTSFYDYFRKRCIRIYPELWISTFLNAFIVCLFGYFNKDLIIWIILQGVGLAYTPATYDCYASGSLNGAMWTIAVLVQMYVVLYFSYKKMRAMSNYGWLIVFIMSIAVNITFDLYDNRLFNILGRTFIPYYLWFAVGIFIYCHFNTMLPWLKKHCIKLCLVYFVYYIFNKFSGVHIPGYYCSAIGGILLPMVTIAVAYRFKDLKVKTDITYQIYLYHWIIINIFIETNIFEKLNWVSCLLAYLIITCIVSYVSSLLYTRIFQRMLR